LLLATNHKRQYHQHGPSSPDGNSTWGREPRRTRQRPGGVFFGFD
jgi:hypothetical protein